MDTLITLRDATMVDSPFIARVVLAGIDMLSIEQELPVAQKPIFEQLVEICRLDDTLYSYRNTRLAEVDGQVVGALVGYDGGRYAEMRAKTFGMIARNSGVELSHNAMETVAGEFYLDSMAILSDYRGMGIGKRLMRDRMDFALSNGFEKVTLLVDKDKPRLQQYYESEGFVFSEDLFVFGSWFNKLVCSLL